MKALRAIITEALRLVADVIDPDVPSDAELLRAVQHMPQPWAQPIVTNTRGECPHRYRGPSGAKCPLCLGDYGGSRALLDPLADDGGEL